MVFEPGPTPPRRRRRLLITAARGREAEAAGVRLLPRGHTFIAAQRGRRPRVAAVAPKAVASGERMKRAAPPLLRVARLWTALPLEPKKRQKPRPKRASAPPPPPLSPEKEEPPAAAFERVRSADGRASLADLRAAPRRAGGREARDLRRVPVPRRRRW